MFRSSSAGTWILLTIGVAAGLGLGGAAVPHAAAAQDTAHVVIVATTDVHGHATQWDYVNDREAPWGLVRVATVVDSLRRRHPGEVVVVDAGDLIQGSPFATYFARERRVSVHPVLDAMNVIGYDAATPGNHEFNFGLDVLAQAYGSAGFPIVSGNIFQLPRDTFAYEPFVVFPRGGVRVGVTGFTTPGTMVWDGHQLDGRLRVRRIVPQAERVLPQLAAAGVDLRVTVVHSGMGGRSSYDTTGIGPEDVAAQLASLPEPPHVVVVGHTHRTITDSVIGGVHFIQPQAWARSVAVAHVWLVRETTGPARVVRVVGQQIPLAGVEPFPTLVRRLEQAHEEVRTWIGTPLATTEGNWSALYARAEDTPVIDFVNHVQRRVAGAQLSSTAAFNTDGGLGPGAVRLRDVAGIYPYENTLRAVRIDGERLKAYLERSAEYFQGAGAGYPITPGIPDYNYDIVSGVEYVIDLSRPVGSRVRQLSYQGRLVQPTDTFTLALNSYRQAGGGRFEMLQGLPVVYDRNENIRDLLVDALRERETHRAQDYFEESWRLIPETAREAVRRIYGPVPEAARDRILLRVLAVNDLHGALESATPRWADGRRVGGAAALAGWMDSLSATCDCTSLRVDAGDEWQGTPISNFAFGRPVVEVFNLMDLDAAAIGNHEFDWGIDTLRARFAESSYPWLGANVEAVEGRAIPSWLEPWVLLERNGLKIALIGTVTESTPTTTNPNNVATLWFPDGAESVKRYLPGIRAQEPDFVILLTHSGAFCDSTCAGEVVDLARGLDSASVDLIVSGHTHSEVDAVINGIPVVQARANGTNLAVVDFIERIDGRRDVETRIETVWTDAVRPDSAVAAVVARYAAETERIASRPIARMRFALERQRGEEYALGNLIADAFRNAARSDVGLINNGGIRTDLPVGQVTYGDLLRVQPFANTVMVLTVTGGVLRATLEHALADGEIDAHVSGIIVRYDLDRPVGERVREIRLDDGRRVRERDEVTLALPDFVAAGGSGYDMLVDQPARLTALLDVEAVVQYLQRLPQPVELSQRPRWVER